MQWNADPAGRRGPARLGLDGGEIEFERVAETRVGRFVGAEHPLGLRVCFDQCDLLVTAAGEPQIRQRLNVDRKDRYGRTIFRRHVPDRRTVGDREISHALAVELDELSDDALLAQHLRDLKNEVGGGDAFVQLAGKAEADHPQGSAS